MKIHKLITILHKLADKGVSDIYAVDDELGVSELRVITHDGITTIENIHLACCGETES